MQWKGNTLVPPARSVLATDLGGDEVKFTVTCIAATKEFPVEHLGVPGDVHGPVRHNGRLYVLGAHCIHARAAFDSVCHISGIRELQETRVRLGLSCNCNNDNIYLS